MTQQRVRVLALDHVQIAMPAGGLEVAREFYGELLGLAEIERPESISRSAGVWFRGPGLEIHLGVDPGFAPARKAHPAFVVEGAERLFAECRRRGLKVVDAANKGEFRRAHVDDPFGNRLEIMERT